MATSKPDEGLEFWLSKATNVINKDADWEAIVGFCDCVNKQPDGPQNAVRLLVHKIQSPQEMESLHALTTLEACVKNCGRRFQQEIGKFRFLNEIIKLLSPKFMGNYTSEKVKKRCIELLFYWTEVLEYEPKIKEAYQMLRRQGIIKQDPEFPDLAADDSPYVAAPPPPPPEPRERNSIFEDEDKSKLLSRLLRSKNPDDLVAANRLIKNMVKQDAERTEKVSKRVHELDIVYNNVKLLNDMLQNHQPGFATQSDKEIMKELYDNLEKHKPNLFRLASEADEADEKGIADVLKANDEVIRVMALYEDVVVKTDDNNLLIVADDHGREQTERSVLSGGGTGSGSVAASTELPSDLLLNTSPSLSILDDQLLKLGLGGVSITNGLEKASPAAPQDRQSDLNDLLSSNDLSGLSFGDASRGTSSALPMTTTTSMHPFFNNGLSQPTAVSGMTALSSVQPFQTYRAPATVNPVLQTSFAPPPSVGTYRPVVAAPAFTPAVQPQPNPFIQPVMPLSTIVPLKPSGTTNSPVHSASNSIATASSGDAASKSSGLTALDDIGQTILKQSLSATSSSSSVEWSTKPTTTVPSKIPMNQMSKASSSGSQPTGQSSSVSLSSGSQLSDNSGEILPLNDVFVPLESIRPGGAPPVVAYDKNGIKIVLHLGKDRPRPDVQVIAVSVMSTNTNPVKGFVFQAAVPKVMKIKLQPASATDLPAYNPILPVAAITQVMLVAHRPQDKILLRFKLTYSMNEAVTTDVGEVQFSSISDQ